MKILITGIHGFVGSNLVSYLKNKHTVYGLDIIAPEKEGIAKTFSWDILNIPYLESMECLPEVDVIIHLAGKAHDTKNKSQAQVYFEINTGLTQKIFDYFLQSNAKQFIFFSSVKAVADKVDGDFLTEDIVPQPVGAYGESKIAAEDYINSQFSISDSQFKSVYIFRPCMIHGQGNKGNLNLLYNVVNKGIPYPLGAFDNRRSFTNIGNLQWIIEQFIEKNPPSGIYNIADDKAISTNELIKLIAKSQNKKPQIWNINKSLIKTIAKIGTFSHLLLNEDRLQKLTENYVVSNQKMKNALKINELPISVIEGLKKTLETF
jgi:nucleoside-diphosphate-sugar epimerase